MDSKKAVSKLDYIEDKNLFRSVAMALWLYLDKGKTLKYSVNKGAERSGATQATTMRLVKSVVPQRLIDSRKTYSPTDDEVSKARASGIINREFKTKPFH